MIWTFICVQEIYCKSGSLTKQVLLNTLICGQFLDEYHYPVVRPINAYVKIRNI